ncbi:MAG: hypothetical protein RQ899_10565 [Pseudomonadales bacterium]|nr:hypothetical protein [Pseudomonadales bacterium]
MNPSLIGHCALIFLLCVAAADAGAQPLEITAIITDAGKRQAVLESEESSLLNKLLEAYIGECSDREEIAETAIPTSYYRKLWLENAGTGSIQLVMHENLIAPESASVYLATADGVQHFQNCGRRHLVPALALMADMELLVPAPQQEFFTGTAPPATEPTPKAPVFPLKNRILARHGLLSSYKPNQLMGRKDSNDDDAYMDIKLSLKYPLFGRFGNRLSEQLLDPEKDFLQLYMAFNGRFSQYLGTRESSPVVARSFNPSLFLRWWQDDQDFIDFVLLGHESNGQQIADEESFLLAQQKFISTGQNPLFARDEISRGWDYVSIAWQKEWKEGFGSLRLGEFITLLDVRHYLDDGPLQGKAEEYNVWEEPGSRTRTRKQYDGISLGLQYNFSRAFCIFGDDLCMGKLALTQTTGAGKPLAHNTSTLELTASIGGLPFIIWGKTGYNSDLVDYYQSVTSWGIGLELKSF